MTGKPAPPGWTYVTLHNFTGGSDEQFGVGQVVLDASGNRYGATFQGGTSGNGVVWEITP